VNGGGLGNPCGAVVEDESGQEVEAVGEIGREGVYAGSRNECFGCDAGRVPNLVDVHIGNVTAVVCFVECEAVWNVGWCLDLHHCKDSRVVMAANRCMLYT
jgi:hypothetical protein